MNIDIYVENKNSDFLSLIPHNITYNKHQEPPLDSYFLLNDEGMFFCLKGQKFTIDFAHPNYDKRAKQGNYRNEMLLRAVGKDKTKHITDLTGGLAKESFLLCNNDFKVTLIEKSPVIFLLLLHAKYKSDNANLNNLELIHMDSYEYLKNNESNEICYADPMFESGSLRGNVKKDVEFLRKYAIHDDPQKMLKLAISNSEKFILKLPKKAICTIGKPSYCLASKNICYHIFK